MVSTPLDPEFCTLNNEVGIENFGLTQQGIQASVDQKLDRTIPVMPTLPLLAGDLRFFASSPALPLWYINLPLFTSTINIEYLVKNKTDLV